MKNIILVEFFKKSLGGLISLFLVLQTTWMGWNSFGTIALVIYLIKV